jgi:hypothetical protein
MLGVSIQENPLIQSHAQIEGLVVSYYHGIQ